MNEVKLVDEKGIYNGSRATFKASGFVTAIFTNNRPFLIISLPANKVARIHRILLNVLGLTVSQTLQVIFNKASALPTGGTLSALPILKYDSRNQVSPSLLVQAYTAIPSDNGTLIQPLYSQGIVSPINASTSGGTSLVSFPQLNDHQRSSNYVMVGNNNEFIVCNFGTNVGYSAPASNVFLYAEVEWSEDNV